MNILNLENNSGRIFDVPKFNFTAQQTQLQVYADVLKKGYLLSHSKFTAEFSEICHIFITVFVIRPGNSRFLPVRALSLLHE